MTSQVLPRFKSVAVLLGGVSREREISLKSGKAIADALRRAGLNVEEIDVGGEPYEQLSRCRAQAVFVALHGTGGEDGTLQEMIETFRLPYTGSDARGSRQAFHKDESKAIFTKLAIPTPAYRVVRRSDAEIQIDFEGPWVIKPSAEGSSIGVLMVDDRSKLLEEISRYKKEYEVFLVEKRITGRELTVGILEEQSLPVIELRTSRSFYDFKAKYTTGFTDYLVPAPITPELAARVQRLALNVHNALGLSDFSRIDIMLDEKENPFVLEANSIPGFTGTSLLPKAAKHIGIEFDELCARILNKASVKDASNTVIPAQAGIH